MSPREPFQASRTERAVLAFLRPWLRRDDRVGSAAAKGTCLNCGHLLTAAYASSGSGHGPWRMRRIRRRPRRDSPGAAHKRSVP